MFRYPIFALSFFCLFNCGTTGSQTSLGTTSAVFAYIEPVGSISPNVETYYKKGEACSYNLLGLAAFGNSSIYKAAEKGQITKLGIVDRVIVKYSFIYIYYFGMVCTKVSGE
ncbi:TRL domain-containing protein [Leptospira ilyithenensis]|nr:TRL domain-containing protein [Leptospira ilyithenensis]